jgi:hypothetical protein
MTSTLVSPLFIEDLYGGHFGGRTIEFLLCNQNRTPIEIDGEDVSNDNFTATAHGLVNDDEVIFTTLGVPSASLPGGLVIGLPYFVVNADTDTFQVSYFQGGTPIELSSASVGDYYVEKLPWGRFATATEIEATEVPSVYGYARQTIDMSTSTAWSQEERRLLFNLPAPLIYTPVNGDIEYDSFALLDTTGTPDVPVLMTFEETLITIQAGIPRAFPIRVAFAGTNYITGAIH